jgi:hypothetical protein
MATKSVLKSWVAMISALAVQARVLSNAACDRAVTMVPIAILLSEIEDDAGATNGVLLIDQAVPRMLKPVKANL